MILIFLGVFVLIIASFLYMYSYNKSRSISTTKIEYGIPEGEITYTDLDKPAKPLFSKKYMLTGKPDFIVKVKGKTIPIELKSTDVDVPFKNHILQLATYCLLIEDIQKEKVSYGVLVYKNAQHVIPFDDNLRNELFDIIDEMKSKIAVRNINRNHNFITRCQFCSFRNQCNQKLI